MSRAVGLTDDKLGCGLPGVPSMKLFPEVRKKTKAALKTASLMKETLDQLVSIEKNAVTKMLSVLDSSKLKSTKKGINLTKVDTAIVKYWRDALQLRVELVDSIQHSVCLPLQSFVTESNQRLKVLTKENVKMQKSFTTFHGQLLKAEKTFTKEFDKLRTLLKEESKQTYFLSEMATGTSKHKRASKQLTKLTRRVDDSRSSACRLLDKAERIADNCNILERMSHSQTVEVCLLFHATMAHSNTRLNVHFEHVSASVKPLAINWTADTQSLADPRAVPGLPETVWKYSLFPVDHLRERVFPCVSDMFFEKTKTFEAFSQMEESNAMREGGIGQKGTVERMTQSSEQLENYRREYAAKIMDSSSAATAAKTATTSALSGAVSLAHSEDSGDASVSDFGFDDDFGSTPQPLPPKSGALVSEEKMDSSPGIGVGIGSAEPSELLHSEQKSETPWVDDSGAVDMNPFAFEMKAAEDSISANAGGGGFEFDFDSAINPFADDMTVVTVSGSEKKPAAAVVKKQRISEKKKKKKRAATTGTAPEMDAMFQLPAPERQAPARVTSVTVTDKGSAVADDFAFAGFDFNDDMEMDLKKETPKKKTPPTAAVIIASVVVADTSATDALNAAVIGTGVVDVGTDVVDIGKGQEDAASSSGTEKREERTEATASVRSKRAFTDVSFSISSIKKENTDFFEDLYSGNVESDEIGGVEEIGGVGVEKKPADDSGIADIGFAMEAPTTKPQPFDASATDVLGFGGMAMGLPKPTGMEMDLGIIMDTAKTVESKDDPFADLMSGGVALESAVPMAFGMPQVTDLPTSELPTKSSQEDRGRFFTDDF